MRSGVRRRASVETPLTRHFDFRDQVHASSDSHLLRRLPESYFDPATRRDMPVHNFNLPDALDRPARPHCAYIIAGKGAGHAPGSQRSSTVVPMDLHLDDFARVAFDVHGVIEDNQGGVDTYILACIEGLQARDAEVFIITHVGPAMRHTCNRWLDDNDIPVADDNRFFIGGCRPHCKRPLMGALHLDCLVDDTEEVVQSLDGTLPRKAKRFSDHRRAEGCRGNGAWKPMREWFPHWNDYCANNGRTYTCRHYTANAARK